MDLHSSFFWPRISLNVFVAALFGVVATQAVFAQVEANGPTLIAEWPEHIELPPAGQAVLRVAGQVLVFDDMTTCGVVEDGLGFMMRAGREDEEGRYQSFRMYRRLAGDRQSMASEEDLVQFSVRDQDNVWSHALMRLQRKQLAEPVSRIHGNSENWPAVNVRYRGTGVWSSGELTRRFDASEIVPAGEFFAIAHCPEKN